MRKGALQNSTDQLLLPLTGSAHGLRVSGIGLIRHYNTWIARVTGRSCKSMLAVYHAHAHLPKVLEGSHIHGLA